MKVCKTIAAILIPIAIVLFFLAMMARIDSYEELVGSLVFDVLIGLMFAASFVLSPGAQPARVRAVVIIALAIWLLVSGFLVSLHEYQVYVRNAAADYGITRGRILQSYDALAAYSRDCGSFPSETQGLDALCDNPGRINWKGPYIRDKK